MNFHFAFLEDSKSNDCALGADYLAQHICIYSYKNSLMHSGGSPYNYKDKRYLHAKEELLKKNYVDECKFRDNECFLNGHAPENAEIEEASLLLRGTQNLRLILYMVFILIFFQS